MKIKLAVTDNDQLIVQLLCKFLEESGEFSILFTASGGDELFDKLKVVNECPDVLLLDLKMEGRNGTDIAEQMKKEYPQIRIIVLSSFYKDVYLGFMIKTGVAAFQPKGISPDMLIRIIKQVHELGFYLSLSQMELLRGQISGNVARPELEEGRTLSEREVEIIKLICQQKTAKEIGEMLFISQKTVEGHKNNIFAKTGAKNIAGLVIYALQQKLVLSEDLPLIV